MKLRTNLIRGGALAILTGLWQATSVQTASSDHALFPNISDNSHASAEAVKLFEGYYTAKSLHNVSLWVDFFDPAHTTYTDATLGELSPIRSALQAALSSIVPSWKPGSPAYPLQILGDTNSAIVHSVDTPGLFGAELRVISSFDIRNGKIIRSVDYWDGRRNPVIKGRPPLSQCPHGLGIKGVKDTADPQMQEVAHQLNDAFAKGDANATAALFSYDAVFEDFTLRTREEGRLAIGRYLQRAISQLPYGTNTTLRHVLGTAQGGGYEWKTNGRDVLDGITILELDDKGAITQLSAVWDGSRMSDADIKALVELSIEP